MLELLLKQRLEYSLLPRNGSHPVIISLLHPPLLEAITQLPSVRRIVLKRRAEKWAAPSASSYIGGQSQKFRNSIATFKNLLLQILIL